MKFVLLLEIFQHDRLTNILYFSIYFMLMIFHRFLLHHYLLDNMTSSTIIARRRRRERRNFPGLTKSIVLGWHIDHWRYSSTYVLLRLGRQWWIEQSPTFILTDIMFHFGIIKLKHFLPQFVSITHLHFWFDLQCTFRLSRCDEVISLLNSLAFRHNNSTNLLVLLMLDFMDTIQFFNFSHGRWVIMIMISSERLDKLPELNRGLADFADGRWLNYLRYLHAIKIIYLQPAIIISWISNITLVQSSSSYVYLQLYWLNSAWTVMKNSTSASIPTSMPFGSTLMINSKISISDLKGSSTWWTKEMLSKYSTQCWQVW